MGTMFWLGMAFAAIVLLVLLFKGRGGRRGDGSDGGYIGSDGSGRDSDGDGVPDTALSTEERASARQQAEKDVANFCPVQG